MAIWKALVSPIVTAVTTLGKGYTERKQAKEAIDGDIRKAKVEGDNTARVAVSNWERLSKGMEDKTWKDEYITVSLVAPINLIVIDSVLAAMGYSDGNATEGVLNALEILNNDVGVPYGDLTALAVAAGLSVKFIKGLR